MTNNYDDGSIGAAFDRRRRFLGALAALGAGALSGFEACAQPGAKPHRIDIHHHLLPPKYVSETMSLRVGEFTPKWSPAMSIEDMDRNGIASSLLSLMQPQVTFNNDVPLGRRLARESNDYGAQLVRDHKGRFGLFATLPLTDADGSLREIEYALDTLKADGFGLMTSYGTKYLGDAAFAPVWQELNRRKAVIYTHPLGPACCKNLIADVPQGMIEYATDTSRTMASLLFTGSAARYPDIRWIFSHGGGTVPFLLSRFTRQEAAMKERQQRLPNGVMHELRKFYYDTAQANHPGALAALLKIVSVPQVLFGTDYPYRPGEEAVTGLNGYGFNAADLRAIDRDNALRLLPRVAG
jgi:predicted TIM-barrel fold metal-dependent hydrolase